MEKSSKGENLFEKYKIRPVDRKTQCQEILKHFSIIRTDASPSHAQALSLFIAKIGLITKARITEPAFVNLNSALLARPKIDLDATLTTTITELFERTVEPQKVLEGQITPRQLAVITLKLALDYARAQFPKINFSENPLDFLAIPIGLDASHAIGYCLGIFEEIATKGVEVEDILKLFEELIPQIFRADIRGALRNATKNIDAIKRPGPVLINVETDEPLTIEEELHEIAHRIEQALIHIPKEYMADLITEAETLTNTALPDSDN
ncbi:MAG: hypothetical protein WC897_04590 [Candidatus Gracilibacteria bacterium]